jgi:predicted phage-related endonuclease
MQAKYFDLFNLSRDQWLDLRHSDITASVVGALFGCHPYQTALSVYVEKSKPKPEPLEDNGVLRRGRWMEAAAIKAARELRPNWQISEPQCYLRDEENRVGCTPDAYFVDQDGQCGVLQVKTVAPQVFKEEWHGEDGSFQVPFWITLQSYTEARLSGYYRAAVAALVCDTWNPQLHIVEFDCPEDTYAVIAKEARRFWQMIDRRQPPRADYGKDLDALKDLYSGSAPAVDLTGDEKFGKLLAEQDAIKDRVNAALEDAKVCKAKIIEAMQDAEAVVHGGRIVTFKEQSRGAYEVKPTKFRVLRVSAHPGTGKKKK